MTNSQRNRDEEAAESSANKYWSRHSNEWGCHHVGFHSGLAHCRETEVKELKARVCLLEKSLIKTPKELHEISEGVERMGFGTSENTRLREQLRVAVEFAKRVIEWNKKMGCPYSIMSKEAESLLQKIEATKGETK